jgi:hypothetical protein
LLKNNLLRTGGTLIISVIDHGRLLAAMEPDLVKFAEFLQRNKLRATYGAIGEAADVPQRSVGRLLGERCPLASWVVNIRTGEPTGYSESEKHPDLCVNGEIITKGEDLIRRMKREKR